MKIKRNELIKNYMSAKIKGLIAEAIALKDMEHKVTKGRLRELFITRLLNKLLTSQLSFGSGVIINQYGVESKQTDIIIYDNSILPPFIEEENIGVYPVECVLATIEVKSNLTKLELLKSEDNAKYLNSEILNNNYTIYQDYNKFMVFNFILGFYGNGPIELNDRQKGKDWINKSINNLQGICLINKYSWMPVRNKWSKTNANSTNEETKRFIAILLDSVRTLSFHRKRYFSLWSHLDWFSIYTRFQNLRFPIDVINKT
ncbi:MAG: hypothetical protein KAU01_07695 [Candidatus Cloacimonetes bacterium]|nr:hypothetical protein [Candidatus Cloacimonadota bacterium]